MRISGPAAWRELQRRRAKTVKLPPIVPHLPTAKQSEFLSLDCLEALYGGAAGGGKTDALLMAALQFVHVPGYAALLLRRTYADLSLPGAIMSRAKAWLAGRPDVHWDEKTKRFRFPSGATLTFGYLDADSDKNRYMGAELQFIGFDELTQFPEQWYRYLLSRLRRLTGSSVPLRARAASNPGGIGHDWVRRWFVDSATACARFVPATLDDNPHLDVAAYRVPLERLDPTTRKQLLEGVWVRDGGGLVYGHFSETLNLGEPPRPKDGHGLALTNYLLGLDFGIEDENAATVLGWRENDPCIYVVESYRKKALVTEMVDEVKALEAKYHFVRMVGDTGGMGKAFTEEMRKRHSLPVEPADKNNKVGYISMLNADLARGRIKVAAACEDLVAEWRELPWNQARTKEAEGFRNHASDATLYAWRACTAYHEQAREERPKPGTAEYWRVEEAKLIEVVDEQIAREAEEERERYW